MMTIQQIIIYIALAFAGFAVGRISHLKDFLAMKFYGIDTVREKKFWGID